MPSFHYHFSAFLLGLTWTFLSLKNVDNWILNLGFGYDGMENNFKVVRILSSIGMDDIVDDDYVEVYSANKNVWRKNASKARVGFINFDDSIAVIISKRNKNNISKINLWVLDNEACLDRGIEASWSLMLNIDVNLPIEFVQSYFKSVVRNFKDFDSSTCLTIFKYAESLVSIPGFKQVNLVDHEDDN
ncbi:hypothetical protein POM88_027316 [Heracleum sosnowskyi]|uniref:F-box associated domain-containing protein n=1 Tax=Heracleum sosnowskyi TaxID=360622 RepID=A0AAD8I7E0_9APIA|nr:hypothetical protein POM88_027316 [Heracleum sosnowskyi]